ncbi:MAG: DNA translocase FtsK [Ruminococcaceae bacterium]|nr:DNA translocase FtsK [Oscillospiraceae bacterium]
MFHKGRPVLFRTVSALLLPVFFSAIVHLLFCKLSLKLGSDVFNLIVQLYENGKEMLCGGVIGGFIAISLEMLLSVFGAFPVLFVIIIILAMATFNITIAKIKAWWYGREVPRYERRIEEDMPEPEPQIVPKKRPVPQVPVINAREQAVSPPKRSIDIPIDDFGGSNNEERRGIFGRKAPESPIDFVNSGSRKKSPIDIEIGTFKLEDDKTEAFPDIPEFVAAPSAIKTSEPEIITKAVIEEPKAVTKTPDKETTASDNRQHSYVFPPIELLNYNPVSTHDDGRDEVSQNRERLENALMSFGVAANIVGVTRGPTITRYDLELEHGVKLTKLTNLSNDLALSLGVTGVRIAPIPNVFSTVGIEVPNKIVNKVYLREIIESRAFSSAESTLTFAIGKNVGGESVVGNISKLPHLLIAGTTGSGKSVCINSMLLSLLYKSTPDEVRMIMIDPKMVELGIYNGIPHLLVPVVTDPKKAAGALQWAVVEMLKRYRAFSEIGVRNIAAYNSQMASDGEETIPKVVIVVDELADLMLYAPKEVEESICRVAQMGRAAGMHLVIATQRPSADVITGLMKANIPSRIAFAVSSGLESRIILDSTGAEKLIGMGDMLFSPLGGGKPARIQGSFVSDQERETVIEFIKEQGEANYNSEVAAQIEEAFEEKTSEAEPAAVKSDYDELLPDAVEVIFECKQASVSMLQRRLRLGYSRAARIVDQMEELGVVGPFEGSKPRQILMSRQEWLLKMQGDNATDVGNYFDDDDDLDGLEDS